MVDRERIRREIVRKGKEIGKGKSAMPLRNLLRKVFREEIFTLYKQPIIGYTNDSYEMHEILLRLNKIEGEEVKYSTEEFIYSAEQQGWIEYVDEEVVRRTFEFIAEEGIASDVIYCINISPSTLNSASRPDAMSKFMRHVNEMFSSYAIPHNNICFEITERIAIEDPNKARDLFKGLRELGCRVSFDDFGKGVLNLNDLRILEPDFTKIDGSFVLRAANDLYSMEVIRSIIRLSDLIHSSTIAEHIEDESTWRLMEDLGIQYGQGWYLGKPKEMIHEESNVHKEFQVQHPNHYGVIAIIGKESNEFKDTRENGTGSIS